MNLERGQRLLTRTKAFILAALALFTSSSIASISQAEAARISNLVHMSMTPLLKTAESTVKFEWIEMDSSFNIHIRPANYRNAFTIYSSAGVYEHANMSREIYALLVCHEFGHVLGGLPTVGYKFISPTLTEVQRENRANLSVEGQADYFATNVCLPAVLTEESSRQEILTSPTQSNQVVACDSSHMDETSRDNCAISVTIAEKAVQLLSQLDPNESIMPRLGQTNVGILPEHTLESYPSFQCRLTTFLSGALFAGQTLDSTADPRPSCWYAKPKHQQHHDLFRAEVASYDLENSVYSVPSFLRKRPSH